MPIYCFPHRGFYKRDVKHVIYAKSVSPNLSHWVIGVFHSISRMETFIFFTGFLKDYKSRLLIFFPQGLWRSFDIEDTYVQMYKRECYETLCPFEGAPFHKDTGSKGTYWNGHDHSLPINM
jgi:hypothetical protein